MPLVPQLNKCSAFLRTPLKKQLRLSASSLLSCYPGLCPRGTRWEVPDSLRHHRHVDVKAADHQIRGQVDVDGEIKSLALRLNMA